MSLIAKKLGPTPRATYKGLKGIMKKPPKKGNEEQALATIMRKREFELYVLWRSFPAGLRGQPEEMLQKLGLTEMDGWELLRIRTQSEFAAKYGLSLDTLTSWNVKIEAYQLREKRKEWMRNLFSNVVMALYRKALSEADAPRVRLFAELVEEIEPEQKGGETTVHNTVVMQKIINIGRKYDGDLRKIYEQENEESARLPGPKRIRADRTAARKGRGKGGAGAGNKAKGGEG